ncbi:PREDICTED: histone-lysine N-methyltransferase, H3 lysine-9 specific SUVH6-like [Tarenaya hassleriana]|uniref:histone-lysine N-methyltransferase, H3 lysine-9 specific SUVH6-like n=1 Tax=Tarenaya hassleriana TaxID=28532 RepID=UPI00053C204B|nr:PREDICTED: histone-lysine N-methyltransferase, H3 lysine-9 specific SUVH6-like [Tarenaya hassleriana]
MGVDHVVDLGSKNVIPSVKDFLKKKKHVRVKELNSYVALKKKFSSNLTNNNKRVNLFDGPEEENMEENVLLASNMTNQELMDKGYRMMDDTDQAIERGKKLKFKRRRVSAVRKFPPGCGPSFAPFRLPLGQEEVQTKAGENDIIPSSDADVELSANEEPDGSVLVERLEQGDNLEYNNEKQIVPSNGVNIVLGGGTDFDQVNKSELMVVETDKPVFAPEDTGMEEDSSDPMILEPVDARPLTMCLPDGGPRGIVYARRPPKGVGSKNRQSIDSSKVVKAKYPLGKQVSAIRDFPTNARRKSLVVREKSGYDDVPVKADDKQMSSGSGNSTENTVMDIVVYTDQSLRREISDQSLSKRTSGQDIGRFGPEKSIVAFSKQSGVDRKKAKEQVMREVDVVLPPSNPGGGSGMNGSRSRVKETLRLFHAICRKLLQGEETKPRESKNGTKRVDYQAAKVLREKGKFVNTGKQIIGSVPGVEIGDEFQYRMELNMIGLHRPSQGGIDYVKEGGELYATSIVASGGYDDELDNSNVLIYTGQGGNVMNGGKDPENQKLERGNLALANSAHRRNPVRVIRGNQKVADSSEAKGRAYVYDGLYIVEKYWQETGPHGKLVFKYKLQRMPGQPELSWRVVKKSKKSKFREGLCKLDISEGKERFSIRGIQPHLKNIYTIGMMYPDWCRPIPPKGCDCTTRCSELRKCSCVVQNGGGIPYNRDGAIVEAIPLVYECGPTCKCPPSCYNRVTQCGIKFQLEIFKTESRGWGVRSLNSIPSGSFICEYAGELLEDKEAERRTGNDEYLFDIGNNYDNSLRDGISELMPKMHPSSSVQAVDESIGFTIDAARYGNVGRFINHSCSPNLYAQNVLFDHNDTRIPHVMFFAMDNIPPLQELTYHYNYVIGQVRDSNGNIKRKDCYCGSSDCVGRLY